MLGWHHEQNDRSCDGLARPLLHTHIVILNEILSVAGWI